MRLSIVSFNADSSVSFVQFAPELSWKMMNGGQHRIRGSPTEGAQAGRSHCVSQVEQQLEIGPRALAGLNPFEEFSAAHGPDTARRALAARFGRSKPHEVLSELEHIRFMVIHHNAAVTENGAGLRKGVVTDREVKLGLGK
jgi:hypothetical protein